MTELTDRLKELAKKYEWSVDEVLDIKELIEEFRYKRRSSIVGVEDYTPKLGTYTNVVLNFFAERPDEEITMERLIEGTKVKYNTAYGTVYRLLVNGYIERVRRGEYKYVKA